MLKRLLFWTAVICSLLHGRYCTTNSAPPRPPRPPPPPPAQATSSSAAEPTPTPAHTPSPPVPLQPNQCSFGAENIYSADFQGYSEADALYILLNHPAECPGVADSLELCYFITEAKNASYTIHLLSFRPLYYTSDDIQFFGKLSGVSVDIITEFFSGGANCQVIEVEEKLSLGKGDVLGFVTEEGFNIALMTSDENDLFQYVPSNTDQFSLQDVLNLETIPITQLKQFNNTAIPALKIVLSKCLISLIVLCFHLF